MIRQKKSGKVNIEIEFLIVDNFFNGLFLKKQRHSASIAKKLRPNEQLDAVRCHRHTPYHPKITNRTREFKSRDWQCICELHGWKNSALTTFDS
ncbi:uncharacterized protein PHALS_14847 [Plasmopara halstedii]|uniref:Uncharacterized protein n=1 Tax=Plasmopara halstedii TaxID=4781 RepID=A0A0N7L3M3_PLAHL|nr:uncharacterized protein PHALS_14847 [Plasmopara halstedii]CEG36275.1 hypothetical protein PHALS_14847 [Plasmopara halstedii]|eukprot:XP_024572644.1 hypothetical protein PHALS_14847 [Plasmopara halstedii]